MDWKNNHAVLGGKSHKLCVTNKDVWNTREKFNLRDCNARKNRDGVEACQLFYLELWQESECGDDNPFVYLKILRAGDKFSFFST